MQKWKTTQKWKTIQKWKSVLAVILLVSLILVEIPAPTYAAEELNYEYEIVDGKAIITGYTGAGGAISIPNTLGGMPVTTIDDHAFGNMNTLTSVVIPNTVEVIRDGAFSSCSNLTTVAFGDHVKMIGDDAFLFCGLTSVTLPDSVTNLGESVFSHNDSLTSVTLGSGITNLPNWTFDDCDALPNITIPDTVTELGVFAFLDCKGLTTVNIGTGVHLIDYSAFYGSTNLSAINIAPGNSEFASQDGILYNKALTELIICPEGKSGAVTIPEGVKNIQTSAFYQNKKITSLGLPSSLETVAGNAFTGMTWFTDYVNNAPGNFVTLNSTILMKYKGPDGVVNIPNGITSITQAFSSRPGITEIHMPSSVTSIGDYAFSDCDGLTAIEIHEGIKSIGIEAFSYASGIEEINLPNSVVSLGKRAFTGCVAIKQIHIGSGLSVISEGAFSSCENLTDLVIPSNVTTIKDSAFEGCSALEVLNIPDTVTVLEPEVFSYCTALKTLTIGSGIKEIPESAFWKSENLTSVTIPNTVEKIGADAFFDSALLSEVFIGSGVNTLEASAFARCPVLSHLAVDPLNPYYKSIDDVIYSKDGTRLVRFAPTKSGNFTVPDGVVTIGDYAFDYAMNLITLSLPSTVLKLENHSFDYCFRLEALKIPSTVTTIENFAFVCGDYGILPFLNFYGEDPSAAKTYADLAGIPFYTDLTGMDLPEVKGLVIASEFRMKQSDAVNEVVIKAFIETKINSLALNGATFVVDKVDYTLAIAGTQGNASGTNGTYNFTVTLSKLGISTITETLTLTIEANPYSAPGTPSTPSTPESPSADNNAQTGANANNVNILVNGVSLTAGNLQTEVIDGEKTATITVEASKIESKLATEGSNAVITIPYNGDALIMNCQLDGLMVKNMEQSKAILEIKTNMASYILPAAQIDIDSVAKNYGSKVELEDIKVFISVTKPNSDTVKLTSKTLSDNNLVSVTDPLEFTLSCVYDGKLQTIDQFKNYIQRNIVLPVGIDASKITTAVVVESDGTTRHIPTKVEIIDGKYYARINSLTNSIYSLVYNPVHYTDVKGKWYEEAANDMGSRMVFDFNGGKFNPMHQVTRVQFATAVVKALGLKPEGKSKFSDIDDAMENAYVNTAVEYGILSGYPDGTFKPDAEITRQDAMCMLEKAMNIAQIKVSSTQIPDKYTDSVLVSSYAKASVAKIINAGIATGRSATTIDAGSLITNAELAQMLRTLLQKAKLI